MGYLTEALQPVFHLLIPAEEISKRLLHGVEVGQGLVLLDDQLLDGVVGQRFFFLVVL